MEEAHNYWLGLHYFRPTGRLGNSNDILNIHNQLIVMSFTSLNAYVSCEFVGVIYGQVDALLCLRSVWCRTCRYTAIKSQCCKRSHLPSITVPSSWHCWHHTTFYLSFCVITFLSISIRFPAMACHQSIKCPLICFLVSSSPPVCLILLPMYKHDIGTMPNLIHALLGHPNFICPNTSLCLGGKPSTLPRDNMKKQWAIYLINSVSGSFFILPRVGLGERWLHIIIQEDLCLCGYEDSVSVTTPTIPTHRTSACL